MTTMIKKRVADLEGAQLNVAVMLALGYVHFSGPWFAKAGHNSIHDQKFMPASNWSEGGPIIEREQIQLWPPAHPHHGMWAATSVDLQVMTAGIGAPKYGRTPLIAAMRAFVASRLGDEVEVPE